MALFRFNAERHVSGCLSPYQTHYLYLEVRRGFDMSVSLDSHRRGVVALLSAGRRRSTILADCGLIDKNLPSKDYER